MGASARYIPLSTILDKIYVKGYMNHLKNWKIGKRCSCLSPPERISPLLTDSLRQIKGTLFDISDWTPQIPLTVVFSSEDNLRE